MGPRAPHLRDWRLLEASWRGKTAQLRRHNSRGAGAGAPVALARAALLSSRRPWPFPLVSPDPSRAVIPLGRHAGPCGPRAPHCFTSSCLSASRDRRRTRRLRIAAGDAGHVRAQLAQTVTGCLGEEPSLGQVSSAVKVPILLGRSRGNGWRGGCCSGRHPQGAVPDDSPRPSHFDAVSHRRSRRLCAHRW